MTARRTAADRPGFGGLAALTAASACRLRGSARLSRSLMLWSGAGILLGETFSVGVARLQSERAAVVAGALTLAWWSVVTLVPIVGASLVATPDGAPVEALGVPNGLTLMRAYSCAGLTVCAFAATPHRLGFILWATVGTFAAVLDLMDGYIARRIGPITQLGQLLDPLMDCVFFSMAAAGNIALGIVPRWMGGIMLARYAGPLGFGIVFQLLGRRPELSATDWGKRSTVLTGAMLAVLLVVRTFEGPVEAVAAIVAPPLVATTLLHFGVMIRREQRAVVAGPAGPAGPGEGHTEGR